MDKLDKKITGRYVKVIQEAIEENKEIDKINSEVVSRQIFQPIIEKPEEDFGFMDPNHVSNEMNSKAMFNQEDNNDLIKGKEASMMMQDMSMNQMYDNRDSKIGILEPYPINRKDTLEPSSFKTKGAKGY
mmetsp:Transcript_32540/g.28807  ORF Transcript_32540/g.28807 Transcript_32540/m.28807 type:complete len:130 (-) Transcript_32540:27-416(-)